VVDAATKPLPNHWADMSAEQLLEDATVAPTSSLMHWRPLGFALESVIAAKASTAAART